MLRISLRGTIARLTPLAALLLGAASASAAKPDHAKFFANHCYECHGDYAQEGGLNLKALSRDMSDASAHRIWVRVHDRIASGEMPPEGQPRPEKDEIEQVAGALDEELLAASRRRQKENGRAPVRRLTRAEYENTLHDLLEIEGAPLKQLLPQDGSAHDTNKHADALDLSYVQIRQYMAAADRAMDLAIATFPMAPEVQAHRAWAQDHSRIDRVRHYNSLLITAERKLDPQTPVLDRPFSKDIAKELIAKAEDSPDGSYSVGSTVNLSDIWKFGASLPGKYRIRASFWGFHYNKGKIEPSDQPQAAALLVENERGESVLQYANGRPMENTVTEYVAWLEPENRIGWKPALVYPAKRDLGGVKGRAQGYTGSGVAVDWIELEGPLFDRWPPESHRRLFGDLPLEPLSRDSGVRPPKRTKYHGGSFLLPHLPRVTAPFRDGTRDVPLHAADPFTPTTDTPLEDAQRLLENFLPRAFRRPVAEAETAKYVRIVEDRLAEGDCFENAMRMAYKTALCSYPFLYRVEEPGPLDDHAIASRLSYFLWNSTPDEELLALADRGELSEPETLKRQVDRLLADPKSDRFIADFLDQWLNLDEIDATTPDEKLYPEFQPFMSDMMLAESRAYFREMIEQNRPAWEVVDSDWAMLNQAVAELYGLEGAGGAECRRVELPQGGLRGGLLTQASVLKVTADGTSTSPVRRGAFVLEKILGTAPTPPPPDIGSIDPDVRGASTVRELLAKHRDHASCASCHAEIDPPGFALESFDPIGRFREHYRSTEVGENPEITYPNTYGAKWLRGPAVDSSGLTQEGQPFSGVDGFRQALKEAGYERMVARNLMERFIVYATGSEIQYADRPVVERMMQQWSEENHRLRDLIYLVVQSDLFLKK